LRSCPSTFSDSLLVLKKARRSSMATAWRAWLTDLLAVV
jgi:hypothetical protein